MQPSHPRLLLVDQGESHTKEQIVRRLVHLGYRVTLVSWNFSVWGQEYFERLIVSRLTHWSYLSGTLRAEHAADPFAGVLSYNEGAVPVADDIARLLDLPRVSRFDAQSFRHKDRMRVAWEAAGLPMPRYRILHGPADARALAVWDFPIVLKHAGMMGSKGVVKVDRPEDVGRVLPTVFATDLDIALGGELWSLSEAFNIPAVALAEQYVPGAEYSAEGVVTGGAFRLIGVTGKVLAPPPYFDEVGHVFPAGDLSPGQLSEVEDMLRRAHAALGLQNAVTHTEFRRTGTGFVLIELNARLAGDHIPELVEAVLGVDLVDLAARCACGAPGRTTAAPAKRPAGVAAIAFLTSPTEAYGKNLAKVRVPDLPAECGPLAAGWYVRPGEAVPFPAGSGASRLGYVAFTAPDAARAGQTVATLRRETEVACDG
jgi:ATP-grasp domain